MGGSVLDSIEPGQRPTMTASCAHVAGELRTTRLMLAETAVMMSSAEGGPQMANRDCCLAPEAKHAFH